MSARSQMFGVIGGSRPLIGTLIRTLLILPLPLSSKLPLSRLNKMLFVLPLSRPLLIPLSMMLLWLLSSRLLSGRLKRNLRVLHGEYRIDGGVMPGFGSMRQVGHAR